MATGEFAEVVLGDLLDHAAIGADRVPLAVIIPEEWTELDDVDPPVSVRHVTFTMTLVVRDEDPSCGSSSSIASPRSSRMRSTARTWAGDVSPP